MQETNGFDVLQQTDNHISNGRCNLGTQGGAGLELAVPLALVRRDNFNVNDKIVYMELRNSLLMEYQHILLVEIHFPETTEKSNHRYL